MSNPCLNQALRQSGRMLTKFYDDKLATVGLRGGQFSVLRAIDLCKVTTNTELQSLLVIDQTTLSRNRSSCNNTRAQSQNIVWA